MCELVPRLGQSVVLVLAPVRRLWVLSLNMVGVYEK